MTSPRGSCTEIAHVANTYPKQITLTINAPSFSRDGHSGFPVGEHVLSAQIHLNGPVIWSLLLLGAQMPLVRSHSGMRTKAEGNVVRVIFPRRQSDFPIDGWPHINNQCRGRCNTNECTKLMAHADSSKTPFIMTLTKETKVGKNSELCFLKRMLEKPLCSPSTSSLIGSQP